MISFEELLKIKRELSRNARVKKYWERRHELYEKIDELLLDEELLFSITPECIAKHHAERMKCSTIIDGFCGAAGNTAQFSKTCRKVIAIEINPVRLEMAKYNAKIMGAKNNVEWVLGDFFREAGKYEADCIFLSSPWGGPEYIQKPRYDLNEMPYNGFKIFEKAKQISGNIAFYVPKTTDLSQLESLGPCEIEKEFINNREVVITAYYGNLAKKRGITENYLKTKTF